METVLGDSLRNGQKRRLTKGAKPWLRAYSFALEMTHAGVSETPRYKT